MTLQDIELTSLDAIVDLTVQIQTVRTYINNTATTNDQNKLSGFVSVGFLLVLRFWTFLTVTCPSDYDLCCYRCLCALQGRIQNFAEGSPTPRGICEPISQPKCPENIMKMKEIGLGDGSKICLKRSPTALYSFDIFQFSFRSYHHSFCHLHLKNIQPYSSMSKNRLHSYRSVRIHHCSFHTHLYLYLKNNNLNVIIFKIILILVKLCNQSIINYIKVIWEINAFWASTPSFLPLPQWSEIKFPKANFGKLSHFIST